MSAGSAPSAPAPPGAWAVAALQAAAAVLPLATALALLVSLCTLSTERSRGRDGAPKRGKGRNDFTLRIVLASANSIEGVAFY